jgi:type VI secretion system protein ImpG
MNPDLPDRIRARREWGELELESGGLVQARFLDGPTAPVHPPLRRLLHWRLISQLSLNPLSIVTGGEDALRELLNLYDFSEDSSQKRQIGGIKKISSRPVVAPVSSEHGLNFASGIHIWMELDEEQVGTKTFLLANILERFFGLYSAINSFSQLRVTTPQRKGLLKEWAPRSGEQIIL